MSRGRMKLPKMPCGCKGKADHDKGRSSIILKNGDRCCVHGHVWKLAWVKVKSKERSPE